MVVMMSMPVSHTVANFALKAVQQVCKREKRMGMAQERFALPARDKVQSEDALAKMIASPRKCVIGLQYDSIEKIHTRG